MGINPIRILIADDHAIFRDGLRRLLATQEDFSVIAEASDGKEAVALATELKPDVLLLDLAMPRLRSSLLLSQVLYSWAREASCSRHRLLNCCSRASEQFAKVSSGLEVNR